MEVSLAAVPSLALRGRSAQWCIGLAANPYSSHAWIAVAGIPAGEPAGTETRYVPVLVI